MEASEFTEQFGEVTRENNTWGLRVATGLGFTLVPLFGILDYVLAPLDYVQLWAFRGVATVVSLIIFALTFTDWGRKRVGVLSTIAVLVVSAAIAVMVRYLGGYASTYYAGLILMIIVSGLLFTWPVRQSALTNFSIVALFEVPALLFDPINDLPTFISNSFFLGTTAIIIVIGQVFNYQLKLREFISTQQVIKAKSALELAHQQLEVAHQQLQQLDRLKSEFFSNITHELRTPLTMILSPLESLLEDGVLELTDKQQEFLRPVRRNALKLLKLINDLLDLAKIEDRFLRIRLTKTDLVEQLKDIVDHTRPMAARKEIDLSLDVRATCDDLHVDTEKMERVVVNLISNALKFTEPNGRVVVALERAEGEVLVRVEDTGMGIPAKMQEVIFQRFSQADGSVARRYGGTGIGLALAKELMELHGGRISLQSTEGEGSCFTLHLLTGKGHFNDKLLDRRQAPGKEEIKARRSEDREPKEWTLQLLERKDYRFLDIEEVTERRLAPRAEEKARSTKVLVVEDNVEVLKFIHSQLHDQHDVYLARDGFQGLEMATREIPDVIVSDYMMPGMDGVTMIQRLRKEEATAGIPVIMLTAKNRIQDRMEARTAGADVYLNKPFSPKELRAAVSQQLERRGRQVSAVVREQVRSLEVISAGLAHEIHNPLNQIRNATTVQGEKLEKIRAVLADADATTDDQLRVVEKGLARLVRMEEIVSSGVERIETIVKLVSQYARDGYPSEESVVELDEVLEEMAALLAPGVGDGVEVHLELDAPKAVISCIPNELNQVIRNLWQNALDAVTEGGNVWVKSSTSDGVVRLRVQDDGAGISPQEMKKIFTPFYSTKGPRGGLGLGLSIAQQFANKAGGDIKVHSRPGEGSTFSLSLPLSNQDSETPDATV